MVKENQESKKVFNKKGNEKQNNFDKKTNKFNSNDKKAENNSQIIKKNIKKDKNDLFTKYNTLFKDNLENKDKLISYIELFIKEFMKNYMINILKRNLSKLLQFCLKKGSKNQRDLIEKSILSNNFKELAFSKYGCYLIKKLLKTTINKKTILFIKDFFVNHFESLYSNIYALRSLHFFIEHQSIHKQQEFLENNIKKIITKDEKIISQIIEHILNKGYFNLSSIQYFVYFNRNSIDKETFADIYNQIKDKIPIILKYSKINGILFLGSIFEKLDFQTQKLFIKMIFKTKFSNFLEINENVIFLAIKIMFHFKEKNYVDKAIIKIISPILFDLENKPNYNFLNSIISNNYNDLFYKKLGIKENSKIQEFIVDNTNKNRNSIIQNLVIDNTFIEKNFVFNLEFIKTDNIYNNLIINLIDNYFLKNENSNSEILVSYLEKLNEEIRKEIEIKQEDGLLDSSNGHRFLKRIIINLGTSENSNISNTFLENFIKNIKKDIVYVINTKSVFCLVGLIEKTNYAETIKTYIKGIKGLNLKKMTGKGVDILKSIIK